MIPFLVKRRQRRSITVPFEGIGLGCGVTISLLLMIFVFTTIAGYIVLVHDLPSLDKLASELDPLTGRIYQPTRLFDRTGKHEILTLQNPAAVGWQVLTLDPSQPNHLPSSLVKATLAAYEPDFWDNTGYRFTDLTSNDQPTIAQRLAYDLLVNKEPEGIRRNLRAQLLAAQLIQQFGHEQVLTWYLNTIQYADTVFGADAAGRVFFNKQATQLDIAESAYLVALSENPQVNPWNPPSGVYDRQREIIQRMLGLSWITLEEASQAGKTDLAFQPRQPTRDLSPAFSQLVMEQVSNQFPNENFTRGGWKITTTLDYTLQLQAECTAAAQLTRVQEGATPTSNPEGTACAAALLLPTFSTNQTEAAGDISAAVIILDPQQGQVLALTGNSTSPRPVGTIITPFLYLSAFTRGLGPASLVWDIPNLTRDIIQEEPELVENQVYRGPVRLRTALVNDYLQPTITVSQQLGGDVIQVTANQLGLSSFQIPSNSSLGETLFESNASMLEVAQAFGIFANQGVLQGQKVIGRPAQKEQPQLIRNSSVIRLQDADDVIWLDWSEPVSQPVISTQLAYLMNHILSDEPARWPSLGHPNPLEIGRPAGAKTGWTLDGQAGWTVGYTPQQVIGVWVGKSGLTPGSVPLTLPAGIWHALIQYANQNKPVETWEPPAGIQFFDVCDPSGLIPTPYCPSIVTEVFLPGGEPTQLDYLYQPFQINRETGRLATVFTPPELIEEKIYLVPPSEAKTWAETMGLPSPPDTYDVIYAAPASPHATITNPEMFSHVKGEVEFQGDANGASFDYYRLQVGQGLNPQTWTQLGADVMEPVTDGRLGSWDTRELSGLYAVQLLVVSQDQRVERAVIQVTVDNQPPQVEIIYPKTDQVIQSADRVALALQAQVFDNLEIDQVAFFIDRNWVATLYDPPYLVSWQPAEGEHTLLVQAVDLAGNESETAVLFEVK